MLLAQAQAGLHKWPEALATGARAVELDPDGKGPRIAYERHQRFAKLLGQAQELQFPTQPKEKDLAVVYTRQQSDDDSETDSD